MHGLPIVGRRPSLPQITVAPHATGSLTGARLHRAGLREHDVVPLGDVLVTSVARTLIGVARHAPLSGRPESQALVLDEAGQVRARLDFYWDEFGVAGEADGRSKYDARDVLTREKRRQEESEDLGIVVTRRGWNACTRPQQFRTQIERAFQRATRAAAGKI